MQCLKQYLIARDRKVEGIEWISKYLERSRWSDEKNLEKAISLLDE